MPLVASSVEPSEPVTDPPCRSCLAGIALASAPNQCLKPTAQGSGGWSATGRTKNEWLVARYVYHVRPTKEHRSHSEVS
jgi:hypothetical protein